MVQCEGSEELMCVHEENKGGSKPSSTGTYRACIPESTDDTIVQLHSTVTDFAKFLGWSIAQPRSAAMEYASNWQ